MTFWILGVLLFAYVCFTFYKLVKAVRNYENDVDEEDLED